jgi:hypothetical protein
VYHSLYKQNTKSVKLLALIYNVILNLIEEIFLCLLISIKTKFLLLTKMIPMSMKTKLRDFDKK